MNTDTATRDDLDALTALNRDYIHFGAAWRCRAVQGDPGRRLPVLEPRRIAGRQGAIPSTDRSPGAPATARPPANPGGAAPQRPRPRERRTLRWRERDSNCWSPHKGATRFATTG